MKEIAISEFKAKCLGILEDVRKSRTPIRITRFGKPMAELFPASPEKPAGRRQLWISPMSVWELLMLTRKRRIRLNEDPITWAQQSIEKLALHEAAMTAEVAFETESLGLDHSDPADRWLAASAKIFNLTLVTGDEKLIVAPGIEILANR